MNNLDIIIPRIHHEIITAGIPPHSAVYYIDYVDTIFPDTGIKDRFRDIPELVEQMIKLGLEPFWIGSTIIYVTGDDLHPIHSDSKDFGFALNIPIQNTAGTYTVWYDVPAPPNELHVNDTEVTFWEYDSSLATEIDRVELLSPALLNIDTPHNVLLGPEKLPRITLSLRLNRKFNPKKIDW